MSAGGLCLSLLPDRLNSCRIALEDRLPHTTTLLQLLLYEGERRDRFFSYCQTPWEISLVLDDDDLSRFDSFKLEHDDSGHWRALRVSDGAMGQQAEGCAIGSISTPLALAGISVFYISTYDADYILVKEHELKRTVFTLRSHCDLVAIDEDELQDVVSSPPPSPHHHTSEVPPHHHPLLLLTQPHSLSNVSLTEVPASCHQILRLILQDTAPEMQLLSITIAEDEMSLVHPEGALDNSESTAAAAQGWRCVQIGSTPLGFAETGIVATTSARLCAARLSIFYLSTFSFDYVLIAKDESEKAVATLAAVWRVLPEGEQWDACIAQELLDGATEQDEGCERTVGQLPGLCLDEQPPALCLGERIGQDDDASIVADESIDSLTMR